MKNLFKYVFMLMVIAMGAVLVSSCSKDDDDDSGSGSASNGTFVIDGRSFKIESIEIDHKGDEIEFVCESKDAGIWIETMDGSVFPTTLKTVNCEVETGCDAGDGYDFDYEADNVPVKCCINGTKCKFIINDANFNGHKVSLTFDGDASKYAE